MATSRPIETDITHGPDVGVLMTRAIYIRPDGPGTPACAAILGYVDQNAYDGAFSAHVRTLIMVAGVPTTSVHYHAPTVSCPALKDALGYVDDNIARIERILDEDFILTTRDVRKKEDVSIVW